MNWGLSLSLTWGYFDEEGVRGWRYKEGYAQAEDYVMRRGFCEGTPRIDGIRRKTWRQYSMVRKAYAMVFSAGGEKAHISRKSQGSHKVENKTLFNIKILLIFHKV